MSKKKLAIVVVLVLLIVIVAASVMNGGSKSSNNTNTSSTNNSSNSNTTGGTSSDNSSTSTTSNQYDLAIAYSGTWAGSYYYNGSTVSINGTGDKTIPIEKSSDLFDMLSADAQKKDSGTGTLTITLSDGSNVLKTASTTSDSGIASISYTSGTTSTTTSGQYNLTVSYSGQWSGMYDYNGASTSISGTGDKTISVDKVTGYELFSADAMKQDNGAGTLTVTLTDSSGNVLKTASTDTGYGSVTISYEQSS